MSSEDSGARTQREGVLKGPPVTDSRSKSVMLRAERKDRIVITDVDEMYDVGGGIPDEFTVARRTQPYFGPKLLLDTGAENYMLTAPGPNSQLLLWSPVKHEDGGREGWRKMAEVQADFGDELPQYDICSACNEPIKTMEHQREAAFGVCSNV